MKRYALCVFCILAFVLCLIPCAGAISPEIHSTSAPLRFSECKTITNPSDADLLLFWIVKSAFTATKVTGIAVGGTSAIVDIQECTSAGAACANIQTASLTVTTTGANTTSFSDASIAAGAVLKLDIGVVTGAVTQVTVCLEGN